MRLDHLMVMNYRSIHHVEVDFGGLTCLVGPNNAGKSNLIDALAFLRDVAVSRSANGAFERRPGHHVRFHGAPPNEPTMFEVTLAAGETDSESLRGSKLQYILRLTPGVDRVETEQVKLYREGQTTHLFTATYDPKNQRTSVEAGGATITGHWGDLGSPLFSGPLDVVLGREDLERFLASMQFYRFIPDFLKAEGPVQEDTRLRRDGSNFATYLHAVQSAHRSVFDRIEGELRKNFPDIEELTSPVVGTGQTIVATRERWFRAKSKGRELSDGLVGFLAHLVALYGPDEPGVVTFEEPENYIHPRLMERLVDMLKGASQERQVILSTHSIPLMNRLDIGDLVVVERGKDGGTTARRVEANAELQRALSEWALGEAYVSGVLDAS